MFTDFIVVNIIISFVLEIYQTVGDDTLSSHQKLQYAKILKKTFPDEDKFVDYLHLVLRIGFMEKEKTNQVIPSREDMRASILSNAFKSKLGGRS